MCKVTSYLWVDGLMCKNLWLLVVSLFATVVFLGFRWIGESWRWEWFVSNSFVFWSKGMVGAWERELLHPVSGVSWHRGDMSSERKKFYFRGQLWRSLSSFSPYSHLGIMKSHCIFEFRYMYDNLRDCLIMYGESYYEQAYALFKFIKYYAIQEFSLVNWKFTGTMYGCNFVI